jgi:preprotein translocase subunit YajC
MKARCWGWIAKGERKMALTTTGDVSSSTDLITYGVGGVSLLLVFVIFFAFLIRLYRRASKETAFVRTGMGGEKVVMNGGALVFPVFHEAMPVNMNTLVLSVVRRDGEALGLGSEGTRTLFRRIRAALRRLSFCPGQQRLPRVGFRLALPVDNLKDLGSAQTHVMGSGGVGIGASVGTHSSR